MYVIMSLENHVNILIQHKVLKNTFNNLSREKQLEKIKKKSWTKRKNLIENWMMLTELHSEKYKKYS